MYAVSDLYHQPSHQHHHHHHHGNHLQQHHHHQSAGLNAASCIASGGANNSGPGTGSSANSTPSSNNGHHHNHHHQQPFCGQQTIDSTTLSLTQGQNKKLIDKGSDEYKKRRERNNVAVRKSREKAKMRSRETERRVAELSKENQLYRAQYEELRREFNVLKSLLLKTGLTEQVIEDEAQRHTTPSTTQAMQQHINQVSQNVHNHIAISNSHHNNVTSSFNNHVALDNGLTCNSVSTTTSNPTQYTSASINGALDQWSDGINSYSDDTFYV